MSERLGNLGYLLMGKKTTKGPPVIPATAIPIYKESFNTMLNHDEDNPIVGLSVMPFNMFMGMRGHEGSFTALGLPIGLEHTMDLPIDAVRDQELARFVGSFRIPQDYDSH